MSKNLIPITPDVLDKWRAEVTVGLRRHFHPDHVHALLDHIAKVEAERDALREGIERAALWLDHLATHVAPDWSPTAEAEMLADAAFVRALLDPEDSE